MKRRGSKKLEAKKAVDQKKGVELSVIIPAYNLEDSLADCLTSILKQDVKMQIIVIDDKSTDSTKEIIGKFAEKHSEIVPLYQPENMRQSAARNAALNIAIGEYIHFCDGDDLVPEGAYRELLQVAQRENADLVVGNYARQYPNDGNAIRQFSHYQAPTAIERCFEAGNLTLWNKIYRRSQIEKKHLRFDEDIHLSEDLLFYMRFLQTDPKAAYTDASIYIYTDPFFHADCDNNEGKIRYASAKFTRNLADVWKRVFAAEITSHYELWYLAYWWNLQWYYDCSWKMIAEPDERQEAFNVIRNLIIWVQEHVKACDWNRNGHMQKFVEIFGIDYQTFCMMPYKDYLFFSSFRAHIVPKSPSEAIARKLYKMPASERDRWLCNNIEEQLEDLSVVFQKGLMKRSIWRNGYWDMLDHIVNDCWRPIGDFQKKELVWKKILSAIGGFQKNMAASFFQTPADVWRFQGVFGVDYPALRELSLSEYILFDSINRWQNTAASPGAAAPPATEPLVLFLNACRNGQIGMRGILRAVKEWLFYKLRRLRRR